MRPWTSSFLVSWFLLSSGCTGDSSAPISSGKDGPAAEAPFKGKNVTDASQLLGAWASTGDGEFDGIELMKDGKALLYMGESGGITVDFSVLEGGRLSLVLPGGATIVHEARLDGQQLELKSERNLLTGGGTQRFEKLKGGKTIAQARQERNAKKAQEYKERVTALEAYLKQPGLVLAVTESGPGAPPTIALDLTQGGGSFTGRAWHDDRPPHLDAISGQLVLNEKDQAAQVTVQFGQRLQPPGGQSGGGQITLLATGDGKNLRIANKITYGQPGTQYEMSLRSDPEAHAAVIQRFDAELARIEALKTPILDALKDFAVLRGELQPLAGGQAPPESAELVLVREGKSSQYRCEALAIGARGRGELALNSAAEIQVVNERPLLRIVCPPRREYLLGVSNDNPTRLAGQWKQLGQSQGPGAQFQILEALDAAARDARFEAQRQAISSLGTETTFTGLAFEDSGLGLEMPISFSLKIAVKADGSVSGTAEYPSMATRMTVAGQMAMGPGGPRLQLSYPAMETTAKDQIFLRSIQPGNWSLAPTLGSGPRKLTGYFTGPPVRSTTLTQLTDESRSQLRKKVVEAFNKDGGRFHLARCTGWQVPGQIPTVVEWKLDEASNKITGGIITGGRPLGANEKAINTYEGSLSEENGWILVKLLQVSQWKPTDKVVTELELMVSEDASGSLYFGGNPTNIGRVVNEKRVAEATPQKGYPIGFVPVSATDAETRAAIDKAIADAEKTRADAQTQAQAVATAADDARRAKFAPFAAPFESRSGSVITTDLAPEMSLVILEAQADASTSTVSGRGLDLREMPFRELTLEGKQDARGVLSLTTSLAKEPILFNAATDKGLTYGRTSALTILADDRRAQLNALIDLGKRLGSAAPVILTTETLTAAAAKTREASLQASDIPGICIYQKRKSDPVAAMFTVKANGKFRWTNEPISLRLSAPLRGKGLYIKGGVGPTDNLTVVLNGVHTANIAAIEKLGAAIVNIPADLEILEIVLKAGGTAQARGVVLLQ